MKNKVIARAWVLGYLQDCDGTENVFVKAHRTKREASNDASERTLSGDGEVYVATKNWGKVLEYCEWYGKDPSLYEKC